MSAPTAVIAGRLGTARTQIQQEVGYIDYWIVALLSGIDPEKLIWKMEQRRKELKEFLMGQKEENNA